MPGRKRIAAIVTEYFAGSHADVIVTKFLKGFPTDDGFPAPRVDLVSLYIDQLSDRNIGRTITEEHGVPIHTSIVEALTLGGFELAFDESKNLAYTDRLKETANGTLDEAIERLRSKLDRQSGSLHQNDDITALLMGISNHNEPDEVAREPGQRRRLQNTPAIR